MSFEYVNETDQLYQVEHYRFRFKAMHVAEIELWTLFNSDARNAYAYQVKIENEGIPKEHRNFFHNDVDLRRKIGINIKGDEFKTKDDTLQDAINVISKLVDEHT